MRRLTHEPTVHFAVIAACLFGVAAAARALNRPVIEIDRRAIEARVQQVERSRGSALSVEERQLAEAAYVDEHILAREARARRLDEDGRIREILYQKMLQVLSGEAPQPKDAELRAYYEENQGRYARPAAVTVEAFVVGARPRRTQLTRVSLSELTWSFGDTTARMVFGAETGARIGPHESAEGEYWFRIVDRIPATDAPPLETIREQVRFDWMAKKEQSLLQKRIAELRPRYNVVVTDGSTR
jgi:hypothetical protein